MKKLTEIANYIIEKEIECFGIRTLAEDENYEIGDECRESYEWDIEHDCSTYDLHGEDGEKAGGTCVTIVEADCYDDVDEIVNALREAIEFNNAYGSQKRAVIGGSYFTTNGVFDEKEGRLVDAYVVAFV